MCAKSCRPGAEGQWFSSSQSQDEIFWAWTHLDPTLAASLSLLVLSLPSPIAPWPHSHGGPTALDLQDGSLHELRQFIVEIDVEVSQLKMLDLGQLTSTAAASSPNAATGRGGGWSRLSCSPAVWASSPVSMTPGLAQLSCSGEVWGYSTMCCSQQRAGPSLSRLCTSTLSQMAVRTRNVCIDFGGNMSHHPCCCTVSDPNVALSSSMGQDLTKASSGSTDHSRQAVSRHPHFSTSTSLHGAQTASLSLLSLHTFLHIIVLSTAGWQATGRLPSAHAVKW